MSTDNNNDNNKVPRVDAVQQVASTQWLQLQTLTWTDPEGVQRKWDRATRTTKRDPSLPDAVVILPLLRHPSQEKNKVQTLLVEQFRPPVNTVTIECPAGLVDAHETVQAAALRELKEETGYVGTIQSASPPVCMSPGLSDETVVVVVVDVDLTLPQNQHPQPNLDDGEHVTTKVVDLSTALKTQLEQQPSSMPIIPILKKMGPIWVHYF